VYDPVLRYTRLYPRRVIQALTTNPVGIWDILVDRLVQRIERRRTAIIHTPDAQWERRLHDALGASWPCDATSEFQSLWPEIVASVAAKGVQVGPESYGGFNDGDAGLVRAIWCLVRHLRPVNVVETGVAHGFTSRFILEALAKNGTGHLSSIDLPPLDPDRRASVGIAVGGAHADRWTLINGSSRRKLPQLLSRLGQIDLFIHDSLHTERNVRFEMDRAWKALRPGGVLVIDDIDVNWGFNSFVRSLSGFTALICEAEPIRPDLRRFNKKGLFGIILKDPLAAHAPD
jgi:hypothetical protein